MLEFGSVNWSNSKHVCLSVPINETNLLSHLHTSLVYHIVILYLYVYTCSFVYFMKCPDSLGRFPWTQLKRRTSCAFWAKHMMDSSQILAPKKSNSFQKISKNEIFFWRDKNPPIMEKQIDGEKPTPIWLIMATHRPMGILWDWMSSTETSFLGRSWRRGGDWVWTAVNKHQGFLKETG